MKFLLTLIQSDPARRSTANTALNHSFLEVAIDNVPDKLGTSDEVIPNPSKSKSPSKLGRPMIFGSPLSHRNPTPQDVSLDIVEPKFQNSFDKKLSTPGERSIISRNKEWLFPNIRYPKTIKQSDTKIRDISSGGAYTVDINKSIKRSPAPRDSIFSTGGELIDNLKKLSDSPISKLKDVEVKNLSDQKDNRLKIPNISKLRDRDFMKLIPILPLKNITGDGLEMNRDNFLMPPATMMMEYKNSISPMKGDHSPDMSRHDSERLNKKDNSKDLDILKKLPIVKPMSHRTKAQDRLDSTSFRAILLKNTKIKYSLSKNLNRTNEDLTI